MAPIATAGSEDGDESRIGGLRTGWQNNALQCTHRHAPRRCRGPRPRKPRRNQGSRPAGGRPFGHLQARKKTYAEMSFVDLPGARGKGSGLDADAIKALGDADAFCLVVRAFPGGDGSPPDPLRQLRDFDTELVLADMALVEKRLDRLRKEHGKGS